MLDRGRRPAVGDACSRRDRRARRGPAPLGSIDPPAGAPAVAAAAASGASAAPAPELTDVVASVRDSVVTITSDGVSSRGFAQIPTTGVGSGVTSRATATS
jgi:hypothetical protein